jgi:NAD(P)H-dependent FMN reductase
VGAFGTLGILTKKEKTMTVSANGIEIVTILGTARPGNYTGKALELVQDELREAGVQVTSVNPAELSLAFPGQPQTDDARELRDTVSRATGVVIATPEYHGSFAAQLKLMIENLGFPSVLVEQLRSVCSHVGGIVLPGPVSVAGVRKLFDENGNCLDEGTEKQIRGVARRLLDYVRQNICPAVALEAMVRPTSDQTSAATT